MAVVKRTESKAMPEELKTDTVHPTSMSISQTQQSREVTHSTGKFEYRYRGVDVDVKYRCVSRFQDRTACELEANESKPARSRVAPSFRAGSERQ